ncbi:MAG: hypothetical protein HY908_10770 [Myxococcales bacterium]|nr:hypothetical protein [Myxococcales bacterium]
MLRRAWITGSVLVLTCGAGLGAAASCASQVDGTGGAGGVTTSSSSSGGQGGAGGGAGGLGGAGGTGGHAPACTPSPDAWFAVNEFWFGDTDWNGTSSSSAWQLFGRDVDGVTTQNDLTGHCQLYAGTPAAAANDAPGGIDNSWGRNLVPIMVGLNPAFGATINGSVGAGEFTLLVRLQGLGAAATQASVPGLAYGGGTLGHAATFDGQDCWPVNDGTLTDPLDLDTSTLSFPDGALAADVWTSDLAVTISLTVPNAGFDFPMKIHQAKLAFTLDADHQGATHGILSGVLDVNEFLAAMQAVAGSIDPSLCAGATWDSLANQMKQAADILVDGTQDPAVACNGISIGLGFSLARDGLGAIVEEPTPSPSPCP